VKKAPKDGTPMMLSADGNSTDENDPGVFSVRVVRKDDDL